MRRNNLTEEQIWQVRDLLFKEDFRRLILEKGESDNYIIDDKDYTSVPNVIACFGQKGFWTVYETDERSMVYNEDFFDSSHDAYKNAAGRRGLNFIPSQSANNITNEFKSFSELEEEASAIRTALNNARIIENILKYEDSSVKAFRDVYLLRKALNENFSRRMFLREYLSPHEDIVGKRLNSQVALACKTRIHDKKSPFVVRRRKR